MPYIIGNFLFGTTHLTTLISGSTNWQSDSSLLVIGIFSLSFINLSSIYHRFATTDYKRIIRRPNFVVKMFRKIYSVFRIVFIAIQNLIFIPSYLFTTHVTLYPIYLCDTKLYWKIENNLYNFLLYVVSSWSWCAGIACKF